MYRDDILFSGFTYRYKFCLKSLIEAVHNRLVMETVYYKGYKIKITPYQLAKSRRWALEFQIIYPSGNNSLSKMFSAVNTYETEQEAEKHCRNLAMQIIDIRPTNKRSANDIT